MAVRDTHLWIDETLWIPTSELRWTYVRSSGPGGQNVNKVNSQAQLAWRVGESLALTPELLSRITTAYAGRISKAGELRIHCDRFRDREKNRQACLDRLKAMIFQIAHPPPPRRPTKVPKRVIEARLKNKQLRSHVKQSRRPPKSEEN